MKILGDFNLGGGVDGVVERRERRSIMVGWDWETGIAPFVLGAGCGVGEVGCAEAAGLDRAACSLRTSQGQGCTAYLRLRLTHDSTVFNNLAASASPLANQNPRVSEPA